MREKIVKALYLVMSLLLAVVFWLYVDYIQGNTTTEEYNGIPITFIGADDTLANRNLMLTGGHDATLDLTLSGPRTVISELRKEDIRVQVDLTSITATGPYTFSYEIFYPDNINESSLTIERASRNSVTVQVGTMYARNVPVEVEVTGKVADGYIYMADLLTTQPGELVLRGKAEDVDKVARARIAVDLTGVTSTIQRSFDYELLDEEGNVVDNSDGAIRISDRDRQVEVEVPVYVIRDVPLTVRVKESAGSLREYTTRCSLDIDAVTLAGEPASLETMTEIVLGEVDLSALLSDTEIPFDIPVPAGCVNLSGLGTTTFSVRFQRNLEIRTFSVSNISPIGLGEGQHFSKLTNSVDVQVRGPAGSMDELTEDNIRIVVDLTRYVDNGTYSVPAKVLVDGNDQVGAVGAYTVACKITG